MRCTRAGDTTSKPTAPRNPSLQPLAPSLQPLAHSLQPLGTRPVPPHAHSLQPLAPSLQPLAPSLQPLAYSLETSVSSLEPLVVLWLCRRVGNLAMPRSLEISAALNRLRSLQIASSKRQTF